MSRYVCPFSRCGRGCWTAWGIKRHVKGHMDRLHERMDAGSVRQDQPESNRTDARSER